MIESSLDKKMKPQYMGPMITVKHNKRGLYILAEMDGAVWHQKVARFRVVQYFARDKINLPEGILEIIDCDLKKLQLVMSKCLETCAGFRVQVEQVQVQVTKLSPVMFPYPFQWVTGM
jgi:hypothetical protein